MVFQLDSSIPFNQKSLSDYLRENDKIRAEEEDRELKKKILLSQVLRQAQPDLPQGYQWNEQTRQAEPIPGVDPSFLKKADPFEMPVAVYDPRSGQQIFVPKSQIGGFQPPGAAPNETEKVAGGYADRMSEQEGRMGDINLTGTTGAELGQNILEGLPFGNYGLDPNFQQLRQAQNDWIRAKLRKESGAVISDKEMEAERKTYFPMPGDGPEVIKQKEAARQTAKNAMINTAGNAYRPKLTDKIKSPGITKPSDEAIEYLRQNPELATQFEQKYGVSAKTFLGM